ncbi:MAG: hypothetical protein QF415_11960 [Candidatus Undinarchaeales archaeon]|nr:hypothetical protein [Candidatus Undinarchaeales archaeon]MDP7494009.1 hypothetical protein [Candidatus Undinarchaeales archaeon]
MEGEGGTKGELALVPLFTPGLRLSARSRMLSLSTVVPFALLQYSFHDTWIGEGWLVAFALFSWVAARLYFARIEHPEPEPIRFHGNSLVVPGVVFDEDLPLNLDVREIDQANFTLASKRGQRDRAYLALELKDTYGRTHRIGGLATDLRRIEDLLRERGVEIGFEMDRWVRWWVMTSVVLAIVASVAIALYFSGSY